MAAGLQNARTYIQSGNVVFDTDQDAAKAKAELESRLHRHVGRPVGVLIREASEMRTVLDRNPFRNAASNQVVVIFLDEPPLPDILETSKGQNDEEIEAGEREVFVHYPSGIGRSRLKLTAMETGTARNMNTVAKLADMASDATQL